MTNIIHNKERKLKTYYTADPARAVRTNPFLPIIKELEKARMNPTSIQRDWPLHITAELPGPWASTEELIRWSKLERVRLNWEGETTDVTEL